MKGQGIYVNGHYLLEGNTEPQYCNFWGNFADLLNLFFSNFDLLGDGKLYVLNKNVTIIISEEKRFFCHQLLFSNQLSESILKSFLCTF